MKSILGSLLAMAAVNNTTASSHHAIREYHPQGGRPKLKGRFANLQKKINRKMFGSKYHMPPNYDSDPPNSRLPINHIHPRHHRATFAFTIWELLFALFGFVWIGLLIYVGWHFISKFW